LADKKGVLVLQLCDVYGERLQEKVDIRLRHQTLSDEVLLRAMDASRNIRIAGLQSVPQGLYKIEIDPPSYLPISQFVNVKEGDKSGRTLKFPVDSQKVVEVDFPLYGELLKDCRRILAKSNDVLGYLGKKGEQLYSALDDVRRAGLLNIIAKSNSTLLSNKRSVLSYVRSLHEVRGDRFFATVTHELREETKNSVADRIFDEVDGSLHHEPDGFTRAGSFKTSDHYGNLQLTFFSNGSDWRADIDIDDANGLEHTFQVMRNALTGRPTHPYDIHQILLNHQGLDPGYRFVLYA
jgi:hypothetical protein